MARYFKANDIIESIRKYKTSDNANAFQQGINFMIKVVCRELTNSRIIPNANVREIEYAEWYYDPNGMDWGLGAWKCSKCHTKNDNLGGSKNISPYMFAGSKFCPQCGAVMKPNEGDLKL